MDAEENKLKQTKIMGVLNLTPDSFSDGGNFVTPLAALAQAEHLISSGADILDLGAESTAPGANPITASAEIARLEPILPLVAGRYQISIDTYKSETARFALERGARMINDVSALRADPALADVVREYGASLVLMHSKELGATPHATDSRADYKDVVGEIAEALLRRVDFALARQLAEKQLILDPGIGRFISHEAKYSWELIDRLRELVERVAPFPVLLGTSRKGFLGGSMAERDPASQLTGLIAATKGVSIIRTHQVGMMRQFLTIWTQCGGPRSTALAR